MKKSRFIEVDYAEPHKLRNQQILQAHPEIKKLFGPDSRTMTITIFLLLTQLVLTHFLSSASWWQLLLVSYLVGSLVNHALFVIIHETAHNLVFKTSAINKVAGIIANLPIGFPMALSFRKYHLLHHKFQGDPKWDADLATNTEIKIVGNNFFMKALWLFSFALIESLRPLALKNVKLWDKWTFVNLVAQVAFDILVVYTWGPVGLAYLLLSTIFSVGLHPVGARWIQEHFIIKNKQETYSYYGILNKTALNVGYHNEHHDFMLVPWSRLPQIREIAPSFYNSLYFHTSWTKLLFRFIFDKNLGLDSRVIRSSDKPARDFNFPEGPKPVLKEASIL